MSKKNKKPRAEISPHSPKTPRYERLPTDLKSNSTVDFRTDHMDHTGPWGWQKFTSSHLRDFLNHLLNSQKMTFQELRDNGSHAVVVGDLIPEAQKRLVEIQKDDLDELFSWRITGKKRVWCIKECSMLWLLWWDPEHQVCPSAKKHT